MKMAEEYLWVRAVLEEVKPNSSLDATILRLKLRYFGHVMKVGHWSGTLCLDKSQDTGGMGNYGCDGLTLSRKPLAYGWMF